MNYDWLHKKYETLVIVILVLFLSSPVLSLTGVAIAQTDIQETEEAFSKEAPKRELLLMMEIPIVITAARKEQPITEAPSTISVITEEDIRQSGAINLPDILRMVPGLDIMSVRLSDFNVTARGFNQLGANGTLSLIDGRSVYLDFLGTTLWDELPFVLEDIKRIEIIRGPGSALYGANAFHGVVNIITKSPRDLKGTLCKAVVGQLSTHLGSVIHAGVTDKLGYKFLFRWGEINQWRDKEDAVYTGVKSKALLEYNITLSSKLALSASLDDGVSEILSGLGPLEMDGRMSHLKFNYDYSPLKLQFFWNRIDADTKSEGMLGDMLVFSDTYDIELQHSFGLWAKNVVTWGGNYRFNVIESDVMDKKHQQNLWAGYLQDEFNFFDGFMITAGARYDRHPLMDNNFSPRASIIYSPIKNHTFRLSVGRAFRSPTFLESYLSMDATVTLPPPLQSISVPVKGLGNKELKPEKITSYEVGYETFVRRIVKAKLALFLNKINNFIVSVPVDTFDANALFPGSPGGIFSSKVSFRNHGVDKAWGGEVSLDFLLTNWFKGVVNYSYQRITDKETGERKKSAPVHKINGGLRFNFKNDFSANLLAHYVDETEWDVGKVDSYTLLNARVGYKLWSEKIEAAVAAFNILNNKHREYPEGDEIGSRLMFSLYYKI